MRRETHSIAGVYLELVHCPPGVYTRGSSEEDPERRSDEVAHVVTLTRGVAMGVFPVTQAQWAAVTGTDVAYFRHGPDAARRPAQNLSWFDAVRFCNALSAALGVAPAYRVGEGPAPAVSWDRSAPGFRLPTEAEWEYAARSGGDAFRYAGSDDLDAVGWHHDNSGPAPMPVGDKAPTRWGLHDMSGNVWEWCWDAYGPYPDFRCVDPSGGGDASVRVCRGGSWYYGAAGARVAFRDRLDPNARVGSVGVRVARTVS